jgi:hypothetical protein
MPQRAANSLNRNDAEPAAEPHESFASFFLNSARRIAERAPASRKKSAAQEIVAL